MVEIERFYYICVCARVYQQTDRQADTHTHTHTHTIHHLLWVRLLHMGTSLTDTSSTMIYIYIYINIYIYIYICIKVMKNGVCGGVVYLS